MHHAYKFSSSISNRNWIVYSYTSLWLFPSYTQKHATTYAICIRFIKWHMSARYCSYVSAGFLNYFFLLKKKYAHTNFTEIRKPTQNKAKNSNWIKSCCLMIYDQSLDGGLLERTIVIYEWRAKENYERQPCGWKEGQQRCIFSTAACYGTVTNKNQTVTTYISNLRKEYWQLLGMISVWIGVEHGYMPTIGLGIYRGFGVGVKHM
jgi:hypothetical protein